MLNLQTDTWIHNQMNPPPPPAPKPADAADADTAVLKSLISVDDNEPDNIVLPPKLLIVCADEETI